MNFESLNDTMKLFKAVVVNDNEKQAFSFNDDSEIIVYLWKHGILLDTKIYQALTRDALTALSTYVVMLYGFDATKMNSTFWKRYEDVEWSSENYLKLMQAIHYQSTYGQGIVGKKGVGFVPEALQGVDGLENISVDVLHELTYISAITKNELQEKVDHMINSGIALKEDTIKTLLSIISEYDLTIDPNEIKNKELMCRLCLAQGIVPKRFSEFTRLMLYTTTGSTLLIQNRNKLKEIISNMSWDESKEYHLLRLYISEYGFYNFADHISRFRKIYLAYRKNAPDDIKRVINKAIKKSKIYHVAMPKQPLERICDKTISINQVEKSINNNPSIFKLIKLLSAIHNQDANDKLYRIRNGKSYLKLGVNKHNCDAMRNLQRLIQIEGMIKNSLTQRLGSWTNKVFYVPEGVHYAVPTSEKQFVGTLPYLTTIEVPYSHASIGVAWEKECDLDLHAIGINGGHIGFNSELRDGNLVHSGDMTHTNRFGYAAEFLKVGNHDSITPFTIWLANFRNGQDAKFDVFITNAPVNTESSQGVAKQLNEHSILFKDVMDTGDHTSKCLMTVLPEESGFKIVLASANIGAMRVPGVNDLTKNLVSVLNNQATSAYKLEDLISLLGGRVITDKQVFDQEQEHLMQLIKHEPSLLMSKELTDRKYIDLSPSKVTASTFIDLLQEKRRNQKRCNIMKSMTFIDMFAGIGGFRSGLEKSGHKCVGYIEWDKFARQSYQAIYNTEGEYTEHDIRTANGEELPTADIWTFGSPCTNISIAGNRKGLQGEQSRMFF